MRKRCASSGARTSGGALWQAAAWNAAKAARATSGARKAMRMASGGRALLGAGGQSARDDEGHHLARRLVDRAHALRGHDQEVGGEVVRLRHVHRDASAEPEIGEVVACDEADHVRLEPLAER